MDQTRPWRSRPGRAAANRAPGGLGEEMVLPRERQRMVLAGRDALAATGVAGGVPGRQRGDEAREVVGSGGRGVLGRRRRRQAYEEVQGLARAQQAGAERADATRRGGASGGGRAERRRGARAGRQRTLPAPAARKRIGPTGRPAGLRDGVTRT